MNPAARFWGSTIGKKMVMAVTGIIMIGFVVGHVLGNLLVFRGPEKLNSYAAFLRGTGGALWLARLVLLASVIMHVVAAVQLTRLQRKARPIGYDRQEPQVSTLAARTIRWGGLLIFFFVILHILHFTTGTLHPTFNHTDVYANMISAFRVPWIAALYVVAMAALGLHLYHGMWSSVRTLGMNRASRDPLKRRAAALLAAVVWLGFTIIPVAILAGFPS
ncbi:MAG: succinate dehydrogenase cytochrome b subunit [Anaerolineae bacterium]|nr:succinate dehydrogenase cytochrome b subunit [Gemmatimonadaceae bacterium]